MKRLSKRAASILVFVMIWSFCSFNALADNARGGGKAAKANELFAACLKQHPEYVSAVRFDLNGDGVDEMLVSEAEEFPTEATLYILSVDGTRLLNWQLFSRFGDYRYDDRAQRLITSTSGSGVAEYSMISIAGDELIVRNIGKNLSLLDLGDCYYDYTKAASSGENPYGKYSFGISCAPEGYWIPNLDILDGHAISREEYIKWHDYFQSVNSLQFTPTEKSGIENSQPVFDMKETAFVDALPASIGYSGSYGVIGIRADGTVSTAGLPEYAAKELESWRGIVQLVISDSIIVGLKDNGTTEVYCAKSSENLTPEMEKAISTVKSWKGITALAATHRHVIGLKYDGNIVMNFPDYFAMEPDPDFSDWTNVREIVGGNCMDGEYLIGIRSDGTILEKGAAVNNVWYGMPRKVKSVSCSGWELLCLQEDGTVTSAGFDGVVVWKDIVQVYAYDGIALGLKKDGTLVFDIYDNRLSRNAEEGAQELRSWKGIRRLFIGKDGLIIGIKENGGAVLVKCSWAYQDCDPERIRVIESWNNLDRILYCGSNPNGVLALKKDGSLVSYGIPLP